MKKHLFTLLFYLIITSVQAQMWTSLGAGLGNRPTSLVSFNSQLYAGGIFNTAGGSAASYIAKWDGSNWSPVTSGTDDRVNALAVYNNELYVGGDFSTAGGISSSRLAKWDGTAWSAISTGQSFSGVCRAMIVFNSELYVAIGSNGGSNSILKYNGTAWSTVGTTDNAVDAFGIYNNELYMGGKFSTVGASSLSFLARWNGTSWAGLGNGLNVGLNNNVYTMSVLNNDLYVGGSFTSAGGNAVNNIAKWNGSAWSALGTGTDSWVLSSTIYNNELYAGGNFANAGGVAASNIAKWNGTSWSALGSGADSYVFMLTTIGSKLYAGGTFTTIGGTSAKSIAEYDSPASGISKNTLDKSKVEIFPNPAQDKITVISDKVEEFSIINVLGQTVQRNTVEGKTSINISNLDQGIYYLNNSGNSRVGKFIKN